MSYTPIGFVDDSLPAISAENLNKMDDQIAANEAAIADKISDIVDDTTPQLGGSLDTNAKSIQLSKGADVASASALPILTDGNYFDVTGTTAITSIDTTGKVGTVVKLHFDGILTLTHNATNLVLPSGANITTAAGDEFEFIEYASGDFRCTGYALASGEAVIASGGTAALTTADTTNFNNNLSAADDTVQKALETLDDLAIPSGVTNLAVTTTTTTNTITSSTGTDAEITEATGSEAGLMTVAHHDKLDGIAAGATTDQSDSEIETAYNNQVAEMSDATIITGTSTTPERVSAADLKLAAETHGGVPEVFTTATGGTITTDGDYKIHTFNSSGTFTVSAVGDIDDEVEYLIIGAGGGGGGDATNTTGGGGAGAGDFKTAATHTITVQGYSITVGAGGAGSTGNGSNGGSSVFDSITSIGGGGGSGVATSPGLNGGSGGGGKQGGAGGTATGTGNNGGGSAAASNWGAGGGGGNTAVGQTGTTTVTGDGGTGTNSSITGGAIGYAGGGGGGDTRGVTGSGSASHGGGAGATATNNGTAGTANTGGGGGGGSGESPASAHTGGNGGSGVVILRYKFQ